MINSSHTHRVKKERKKGDLPTWDTETICKTFSHHFHSRTNISSDRRWQQKFSYTNSRIRCNDRGSLTHITAAVVVVWQLILSMRNVLSVFIWGRMKNQRISWIKCRCQFHYHCDNVCNWNESMVVIQLEKSPKDTPAKKPLATKISFCLMGIQTDKQSTVKWTVK